MSFLYELRGVRKDYGAGDTLVTAVDGVDLTIDEGEFVVVAGPSGSGKTTLLQLLGALDRPTGGEILFEGQDLQRKSDSQLAVAQAREVLALELDAAARRPVERAEQLQQRGLARPRGPRHDEELAGVDLEVDVLDGREAL